MRFIWTIIEPMNGPRAIPATEVKPKIDIGMERALSPRQMSAMLPPTIFMTTEDAPPPKNRVMSIVAKFCAKAEPKRLATKMIYAPTYPGIPPLLSVMGTKTKGQKAAPIFQLVVAQTVLSMGMFCTLKRSAM